MVLWGIRRNVFVDIVHLVHQVLKLMAHTDLETRTELDTFEAFAAFE